MESQRLRSHLQAEASRNKAIIVQLRSLLAARDPSKGSSLSRHDLSFLTSTASAKALNTSISNSTKLPITTNTNFALSQLPALRALLADLRPKLASLQTSSTGIDSVRAERRQERREYIEQRAKLQLERNRESASVKNPTTSGKRVEPEEVEALEKVAEIFDNH
jgi:kinetochore protein Mis12/MTW1